jgi:protein FRG1
VRQVWVATKIAGTDGVNFKGHHGRYVSVLYAAALENSF